MKQDFTFASDNTSGIHPSILSEIENANISNYLSYGDDPFTDAAKKEFKKILGEEIEVFFVLTGTGANVLSIRAATDNFNSVICTDISHINQDECGAPESLAGVKLIPVRNVDGKLSIESIKPHVDVIGNEHHSQPRLISITQPTEVGTLYTADEIKKIADFAHTHNMYLHIDGARIANAVVSLGVDIKDITVKSGVDIMSFGGTKNGMMIGEAVVVFNHRLTENLKYKRKQLTQLFSKMRFVSSQFLGYFRDNLWLKNASHANKMAELLANGLKELYPFIEIVYKVQSNGVFIKIPFDIMEEIRKRYFFYIWDSRIPVVRLMTSFNTHEDKIASFISELKSLIARR